MRDLKPKTLLYHLSIPIILLIFIRPLFSGLAYPVFETYYESSIIFLAIISLFFYKGSLTKSPYILPILLLLLAYLLSAIASISVQNSLKEIMKFMSYISIFILVSQADDRKKRLAIKAIVIAGSIISLYSIYQYFWGYPHTLEYLKKIKSDLLLNSSYARDILIARRAIGTFPSPNILASYLVLVFFLSLYLVMPGLNGLRSSPGPFKGPGSSHGTLKEANSSSILFSLAPFLIIGALILTKSMGAWLSLAATFVVPFFLLSKSIKKRKLIFLGSLGIMAFAIGFILLTRWERLIDLHDPQNSITQRLDYWRAALAIIKDHPILGVGPGNFQEVFLQYKVGLSTNTRYAHNIFLHTWAETGLLGAIAVSSLIVLFFKKCWTGYSNIFIALSGLAFILCNLIDNSFFIPQAGLFFWLLLSLQR